MSQDDEKPKLVEKLIKDGTVDPMIGYYITLENLCETFGWTPEQVENMKVEDLEIFKAILRGKSKSASVEPQQVKRLVK
jgi:hypothetical protein